MARPLEDWAARAAARLLTGVPGVLPLAERRAARRAFAALFAEVAADPAYARLPRVAGHHLLAALGGRYDLGHAYTYTPPGELTGGLVFLHGHGFNPPVLLHALRPLADRCRLAVVAPSFGYGNWDHPKGVRAVGRALGVLPPAARHRVVVMGLSQGGAGVGRAGAALGGRLAGLAFVSATMEPRVLASAPFRAAWRGRPVLVIHGTADRSVSPAGVDRAVARMRAGGAVVTDVRPAGAGHGLFFADRDRVADEFERWLAGPSEPRPSGSGGC